MDIDGYTKHGSDEEHEGCGCEDLPTEKKTISAKLVSALLNGEISLPERELFPLPAMVNCLGGCSQELFCRLVSRIMFQSIDVCVKLQVLLERFGKLAA